MGRSVTDRDTIVAAAAHLFNERGYRNTTIDDVAKYLGIAKPTVYAHIESKRKVLEAIFDRVMVEMSGGLAEIMRSEDDPEEQLRQVVYFGARFAVAMRGYLVIFYGDERELEPKFRKRIQTMSHQITDEVEHVVRRCIDKGVISGELDATITTNLVLGMVNSAGLGRWFERKESMTADHVADQMLILLGIRRAVHAAR